MDEILRYGALISSGIFIGIVVSIVILRKQVFKIFDYNDGLPDLEDVTEIYFPKNPEDTDENP